CDEEFGDVCSHVPNGWHVPVLLRRPSGDEGRWWSSRRGSYGADRRVASGGRRSVEREDEDAVAHARRLVVARRLEGDTPAVVADDGIRRLVAVVVTPMRQAHEVAAVGLQRQLPDIDETRVLPVRAALLPTRLDQRPLPIPRAPLDLVVLIRKLAIRPD